MPTTTTQHMPRRDARRGGASAAPAVVTLPDGSPACPICGGRMWDNRSDKNNPKAPDFRCRNRECEGRLWPGQFKPDAGSENVPGEAPTVADPGVAGPLAGPVRAAVTGTLRACYAELTEFVLADVRPRYERAGVPCDGATVAAITATLFIATCRGSGAGGAP